MLFTMKEELLIYVWKYKLFNNLELYGTQGESVKILSSGVRNENSGPDFFNSKLEIDGQLWAGNTEMHIKSSDWISHKHHLDKSYSNVILHVVFKHDKEIFISDRRLVVLELSNYIDSNIIENYSKLTSKEFTFLKCSGQYKLERNFIFENWLNSIYVSRIERKNNYLLNYLSKSKNNWEYVFNLSLAYAFGLKLNSEAFLNLLSSIPELFFKKHKNDINSIEAMLFGQAGFLNSSELGDEYYKNLQKEYLFLKKKYSLQDIGYSQFSFFRTRPINFPTIRLSQLAHLFAANEDLFHRVINSHSLSELRQIFTVKTNEYWDNHYTFSNNSKYLKKYTSKMFIERLIINCVIPFRLLYFKNLSREDSFESSLELLHSLKAENNVVTKEFNQIYFKSTNALETQAQLEIKEKLCVENKCLSCYFGKQILALS